MSRHDEPPTRPGETVDKALRAAMAREQEQWKSLVNSPATPARRRRSYMKPETFVPVAFFLALALGVLWPVGLAFIGITLVFIGLALSAPLVLAFFTVPIFVPPKEISLTSLIGLALLAVGFVLIGLADPCSDGLCPPG